MSAESAVLDGVIVVNLGINLPPVAAASRLAQLGATVEKVEPPSGDPMAVAAPALFAALVGEQPRHRLDLKTPSGLAELESILDRTDVLLTAMRPQALVSLGLTTDAFGSRHPGLLHVSIVGYGAPDQHLPGHDLTYVAELGLLDPPSLPRTLVADLCGGERVATAATALLYARERGDACRFAEVALGDAAAFCALPLTHGVTSPGGLLGGGDPLYGIYAAQDGWVAVAALEPHFRTRLLAALDLESDDAATLADAFLMRSLDEWDAWAIAQDLPVRAVRGVRSAE